MRIEFAVFELMSAPDFVDLYDDSAINSEYYIGQLFDQYLGQPLTYTSTQEDLYARFITDSAQSRPGFNATYMAVEYGNLVAVKHLSNTQ